MISTFLRSLLSAFKTRRALGLENLALRQQVAVLRRSVTRPRLSNVDRGFWVLLFRIWKDWRRALVIVKPETVTRWHRSGFKRYWTWKSRKRGPGRPVIDPEIRALIRTMCEANVTWGAPRVHGELTKLGIQVSQAAISKYMIRHPKPHSPCWRMFPSPRAVFMSSLLLIVTRFRAESESSQGLFLAASITITGWPAPLD